MIVHIVIVLDSLVVLWVLQTLVQLSLLLLILLLRLVLECGNQLATVCDGVRGVDQDVTLVICLQQACVKSLDQLLVMLCTPLCQAVRRLAHSLTTSHEGGHPSRLASSGGLLSCGTASLLSLGLAH